MIMNFSVPFCFAKLQVETSLSVTNVLGVKIKEAFLFVVSLANDVIAFVFVFVCLSSSS